MVKETGNTLRSDKQGNKISTDFLNRQHPELTRELQDSELMREYSNRKPAILPGVSLIFVGTVAFVDVTVHYLIRGFIWSIPALAACLILFYIGIRLTFFVKREYVFITTSRLVYRKVGLFGKPSVKTVMIPISEISGAHLYKNIVMYRAKSSNGDVLLKLKSGKTFLLPTLCEGEYIAEAVSRELSASRRQDSGGEDIPIRGAL